MRDFARWCPYHARDKPPFLRDYDLKACYKETCEGCIWSDEE